jgi:ABC-2 type transport system permease protein
VTEATPGILLPISGTRLAGDRLGAQPDRHVVDGGRADFRGDIVSSEAGIGFAITIVLVLLGLLYGTRMFRRESA